MAEPRGFKQRRTFGSRVKDAQTVKEKYPDKIPMIIERYGREKNLPTLEQTKFLIPAEFTMCDLVRCIRRRMNLHPNQSFFFLVNDRALVSNSATVAEVYEREKDDDGFLYVVYASQEMFG
jgi:microtubule-associated protein 1 light chain